MTRSRPRFLSGCSKAARRAAVSAAAVAVFLLLAASPCAAQQTLWGSSSKGGTNPSSLFAIDRATGLATFVGSSGLGDGIGALRFDPITGVLYGILGSNCTGARLVTVDAATGAGTLVGPVVGDGFDGGTTTACAGGSDALAFAPDGSLYVGGYQFGAVKLLKVDKTTAAVLESHPVLDSISGLAFDPAGRLWACHGNAMFNAMLHTIDPATGAYTSTLPLSEFAIVSDLAFTAEGTLYASLPSENMLATIDPTTGLLTRIGVFGATVVKVSGLAFSPPPPTPTPTSTPTFTPTPTPTPTYTPTDTPTPEPTPTPTPTPTSTPTPVPTPTPTPTPTPPGRTVPGVGTIGPARLWIGLNNSDDPKAAFDVRVELTRNGATVASGMARCVSGFSRLPSAVAVGFDPFASFPAEPGDVFSFRVSNRMGTRPDGEKCSVPGKTNSSAVGLRLYYDSPAHASRFDGTLAANSGGSSYLHSDGTPCSTPGLATTGWTTRFLNDAAPEGPSDRCAASASGNPGGDNPWKEIGAWRLTIP